MLNFIRGVFLTGLLIFISTLYGVNPIATNRVVVTLIPTPTPTTYHIGDYAQGGVIFWLTPDLKHGLVASIVDMNSGNTLSWWPQGTQETTPIGATGNRLSFGENYTTNGKINSSLIVAKYGSSTDYAAGACAAYSVTVDGVTYDDWYLPSLAELGLMMSMQSTINSVSTAQGGANLQLNIYWSSFEDDADYAWIQYFSFPGQDVAAKGSTYLVRAVRAF